MSEPQEFKPYRYTDADVVRQPDLLMFAEEYASQYIGDFPPMLAAQSAWVRNGYLTTAVARLVLNCARTDPDVAYRIPGKPTGSDAYAFETMPTTTRITKPPRQLSVVKDPPRRAYFDLNARIKVPFYVPQSKQATRAHLVNHKRCTITYYPRATEVPKYRLRVYTWCCSSFGTAILSENTMGLTICPTCIRYKTDYETKNLI